MKFYSEDLFQMQVMENLCKHANIDDIIVISEMLAEKMDEQEDRTNNRGGKTVKVYDRGSRRAVNMAHKERCRKQLTSSFAGAIDCDGRQKEVRFSGENRKAQEDPFEIFFRSPETAYAKDCREVHGNRQYRAGRAGNSGRSVKECRYEESARSQMKTLAEDLEREASERKAISKLVNDYAIAKELENKWTLALSELERQLEEAKESLWQAVLKGRAAEEEIRHSGFSSIKHAQEYLS